MREDEKRSKKKEGMYGGETEGQRRDMWKERRERGADEIGGRLKTGDGVEER
jgi:hypothetical protein